MKKFIAFYFALILPALVLYGLVFFYYSSSHNLLDKVNFSASLADSDGSEAASSTETSIASSTPEDIVSGEASIIFVGDMMLSRGVAQKIKEQKDLRYPFLKIGDYLKTADLVFGNLETALTEGREIGSEETVFRSAPEVAFVLKDFGFSVISLANNHTMNFGRGGLADTMLNLAEAQVAYAGAGRNAFEAYWPTFIAENGVMFAFLAYTDNDVIPASYFATATTTGVAYMDTVKMKQTVNLAKLVADVVIVSMHSGTEYIDYPNTRQKKFAHAAVDAGADLVIGHHPHVAQSAEKYKGKYIFYSLGNFIFDQRAQRTKEGIILKAIFNKQGIKQIKPQAIYIENFSQPTLLSGEPAQKVISRLKIVLGQ